MKPTPTFVTQPLPYRESACDFFDVLRGYDGAVWLDSCAHGTEERYDVISAAPYQKLINEKGQTYLIKEGQRTDYNDDPLTLLSRLVPHREEEHGHPAFTHGVIGYVGYEYGLRLQHLSGREKPGLSLPDVYFGFYDWAIVIDHHECQATLGYVSTRRQGMPIDTILALWENPTPQRKPFSLNAPFKPLIPKQEYELALDEIKGHLIAGDTYQVNFSHRFQTGYNGDLYQAYCYLREINPMPYACFMRVENQYIMSFSPELFFKATDREVVTQPIKGTIRREQEMACDQKVKRQLRRSEKDRAENTMIVDLLRNDLSRVCQPFSVKVPALCALKTFTSVHHLVSTVVGELQPDISHAELFRALFPCGSITGAPKHETMKIIDALEKVKRHVYCGSIGYFSANAKSQFNVAIRTMMTEGNQLYCSGGGGIVLDSDKDSEYQETLDKINILTEALGRCNYDETLDI